MILKYRLNGNQILTITYIVVSASVIISAVDANLASVDASISSNAEVVGREGRAVILQDHLSLQESTLRDTCVGLFGLSDHE